MISSANKCLGILELWWFLNVHVHSTYAFFQPPISYYPSTKPCNVLSSTELCAKAAKKKNIKHVKSPTTSSAGGFGKGSPATVPTTSSTSSTMRRKQPPFTVKAADEDYSVFPALEAHVAETLIPCPASWRTHAAGEEQGRLPGDLPVEIYDRLDQIYGFPHFNYASKVGSDHVTEEGGGSISFIDLLATPQAASDASSGNKNENGPTDVNFADLWKLPSMGEEAGLPRSSTPPDGVSPPSPSKVKDSEMRAAISSLPPFEKLRVLHVDPLVVTIDDFFSDEECVRYVAMSLAPPSSSDGEDGTAVDSFQTRSKTVGKDAAAKAQRTSTTWFHHYRNVPELMAKASRLIGLDDINRWEEPQTVRYLQNERFTWHLDALAPHQAKDELGGQRTATLLVYLNDLQAGGATIFRDLVGAGDGNNDATRPLKVQPKKGTALLFFPAAGGIQNTPFDIRTLHCGEVVADTSENAKWISQLWLRQTQYTPSAPPGNLHELAFEEVIKYCTRVNHR